MSYHNVDKNDMKTNGFKFENEFVSMCFSTPKRWSLSSKKHRFKNAFKSGPKWKHVNNGELKKADVHNSKNVVRKYNLTLLLFFVDYSKLSDLKIVCD